MTTTVVKFGGTSVADYQSILACCRVVNDDPTRRLVVVSAPSGITNLLVELSQVLPDHQRSKTLVLKIEALLQGIISQCEAAKIDTLSALNSAISQQIDSLNRFIQDISNVLCTAEIDHLLSFGEGVSCHFFCHIHNHHFANSNGCLATIVDSRSLLVTDNAFGQASPDVEHTRTRCLDVLLPQLEKGVVITQGFVGATQDGETTTLGRGGSDYSAALFAEAIDATLCEIWTDVAGVYSSDPRLVKSAVSLSELSYDEAAEMANFGAKVLHPATLAPTLRANIPVFVGASKSPEKGGTTIMKNCFTEPPFRALTRRCNQELVTIQTPEMKGTSGFLSQVFNVLHQHQISVDLITTSEVAVALTFDQPINGVSSQASQQQAIDELRALGRVKIDGNLDLITIIGNHLQSTAGVSAKIFSELEQHKIRMVCYGANPHNLSFLVASEHSAEIINRLHTALIN